MEASSATPDLDEGISPDSTGPSSPAEVKKRTNTPVKYEVYRVGQGTLHVVPVEGGTVVEAANDVAAISKALGDQPQAGAYVAIPLRSLRVREVAAQTTVKVVIS